MNQEVLQKMENESGYFHHNQYYIEEITEESITLKANINENSLNPYGIAHGGFIFGLGDTAMGILAREENKEVLTLNANIDFLRPGSGKELIAKSEMIKNGKKIKVLKENIYNEEGKLIASMTSNYMVI